MSLNDLADRLCSSAEESRLSGQPLAIDLFCGLGGWAEGFLAEGYRVIGFDIERRPYPGQLVLQDVMTLHGSQFKDAAVIVASPPCQAYSYRAMPWKRAKALPPPSNELFDACFRIQREANEAAYRDGCTKCGVFHPATRLDGCEFEARYIPLVVENVRGAEKWVGSARWHFGSYYLWGDVPALMPKTFRTVKVPGFRFDGSGRSFQTASVNSTGVKVAGLNWSGSDKPGYKAQAFNTTVQARLRDDFGWSKDTPLRNNNSHSAARKQASAEIAKIPFDLANHIALVYRPAAIPRNSVRSGVEPLDSGEALP